MLKGISELRCFPGGFEKSSSSALCHRNCRVAAITRCIFIKKRKKERSRADMLTAHSFCSIPPRHQALLSGRPIKAEGSRRLCLRLRLVNGREVTPIRGEKGEKNSSNLFLLLSCILMAVILTLCTELSIYTTILHTLRWRTVHLLSTGIRTGEIH